MDRRTKGSFFWPPKGTRRRHRQAWMRAKRARSHVDGHVPSLGLDRTTTVGLTAEMDELDPYRCAKILIDEHGPLIAWQKAASRAVELVRDHAGCLAWVRILDAVDELTRTSLRNDERLQ